MPRFRLSRLYGQSDTALRQSRNAVSALGQRESFATYVGTWLAGIAIAVVLMLLIAGVAIFGSDRPNTAAAATSDRNSAGMIGNQPVAQRETIAQDGYKVFVAVGCNACHQQGGYATTGQGPRLVYSQNARDSTYVHSIVRWGYNPMPAFPAKASEPGGTELSDADLYKIIVYLQYAHDNRAQKPDWVK
ncbi:MAG TPA: cytochrome c [Chloroflexia bacterium]|nr:cytochrome c [Chloroflexia bacterium]